MDTALATGRPARRGLLRTSGALLLPHWRAGTPALLSLLPTIAYTIAFPLALKLLIDEAIPAGDGSRAAALVAAMLGLLALCTVGDALNHYFTARVVADVLNSLRLRLFSHLQELSLSFYAGAHSGQVFSRYVSGTEA
ncbi:MAG: hypothetical protein QOF51_3731, partial [Chloroflexota bacterium]|nr:hypothetical protein [Chloroflexota bacterium]